jgi:HEAT repeat protein
MRAVSLIVMFALSPVATAQPPKAEPRYKGKPVTYWVERLQNADTDQDQAIAGEAITTFGPDAAKVIPKLIELLDDRSVKFQVLVVRILGELGPTAKEATTVLVKLLKEKPKSDAKASQDDFALSLDNVSFKREIIECLVRIRPDGKEIVPIFAALLDDDECSDASLRALCKLGPAAKEAIPAIRRTVLAALTDAKDKEVDCRIYCGELSHLGPNIVPLLSEMLDLPGSLGRDYAFAGLKQLGPAAKKAAPKLVALLKHDDPGMRFNTAQLLWGIEKNPAVIPVLTVLVTDKDAKTARSAVYLLGEIGPAAKTAIPALKKAEYLGSVAWYMILCCTKESSDGGRVYTSAPGSREHELFQQLDIRQWTGGAARQAIEKIEAEPKN